MPLPRLPIDDAVLSAARTAAGWLRGAKRVLISTGAGMSADSGIPTYRDPEGRWTSLGPFAALGLHPREFANPPGFRARPADAWGYYHWLRRCMGSAPLHEGYGVLTRWVREEFSESFVLTTNIDGLHARAGIPGAKLFERYGSVWDLQCLEACRPAHWPDTQFDPPRYDPSTLRSEERDRPRCPFCGALARPRVQMDEDPSFLTREEQSANYERFRSAGEPDVLLVVGTTLWFSWPDEVRERPKVISVNPDAAQHAYYTQSANTECAALTLPARSALRLLDVLLAHSA